MTNLLASIIVTVVTNVTEEFPKHLVPDPIPSLGPGFNSVPAVFRGHWENDANPTQKKVTTTCKEITTLQFEWNGHREIVSERVLWESECVMELKSDWVKSEKPFPVRPW